MRHQSISYSVAYFYGGRSQAVLANEAYDSNVLRKLIADMSVPAVIPLNRSHTLAIPHGATVYKHRNRIGRCFNRLKHFCCFAARYDRRTIHFADFAYLAATMISLR